MKTALTSIAILVLALGCTNQSPGTSHMITTIDEAVIGDQVGRVTMTEDGDGTADHPLGIDFDFSIKTSEQLRE